MQLSAFHSVTDAITIIGFTLLQWMSPTYLCLKWTHPAVRRSLWHHHSLREKQLLRCVPLSPLAILNSFKSLCHLVFLDSRYVLPHLTLECWWLIMTCGSLWGTKWSWSGGVNKKNCRLDFLLNSGILFLTPVFTRRSKIYFTLYLPNAWVGANNLLALILKYQYFDNFLLYSRTLISAIAESWSWTIKMESIVKHWIWWTWLLAEMLLGERFFFFFFSGRNIHGDR